jgi:putative FmdB family regulatory protein
VPTYQYACTECGHAFEQFQSFSDDALTVCPACEGRLRKVFNAVGVVFKGSGFYRNDSRTKTGTDEKPAAAAAKGSGDSDSSGSSEKGGSEKGGSEKSATPEKSGSKEKTPATPAASKGSPSAA